MVAALTSGSGRRTRPGLVRLGRRRRPSSGGRARYVVRRGGGDSTTGVPGALLPNASWPEVFFPLSDVIGEALLMKRRPKQTTNGQRKYKAMTWARELTYLVAALRPRLHGLGGVFFILLFDLAPPVGLVLNVARPCTLGVGWGVSATCPTGDRAVVAFGDYTLPS
jgi:hypothetical protein